MERWKKFGRGKGIDTNLFETQDSCVTGRIRAITLSNVDCFL